MKLLQRASDGGGKSGVTGFWLCEFKSLFSIVILRFSKGSRDNYHSHAFNAWTWWLKGVVIEHRFTSGRGRLQRYAASFKPKYTPRKNMHRVEGITTAYAISFRGPWHETWQEYDPKTKEVITLTTGRVEVSRAVR